MSDWATDQLDALATLFITRPGVTPPDPTGRRFGANSIKVDGRIFVMVTSIDGLTFKLPRDVVAGYIAAGQGHAFDANKGIPMKEWFVVAEDSTLDLVALAEAALAFVARAG